MHQAITTPARCGTGRALRGAALALALAACGGPGGPAFEPAPETRAAPAPALVETARFRGALARAEPDARRLAAAGGALTGRTEALRDRAAGLAGPVVDPALRPRLLEAAGARPESPQL